MLCRLAVVLRVERGGRILNVPVNFLDVSVLRGEDHAYHGPKGVRELAENTYRQLATVDAALSRQQDATKVSALRANRSKLLARMLALALLENSRPAGGGGDLPGGGRAVGVLGRGTHSRPARRRARARRPRLRERRQAIGSTAT